MYCSFLFLWSWGLKCRRKDVVENVIYTRGTDFGGKLLLREPLSSYPLQNYIFLLIPFFCHFLLLSATWNSARWRWTYNGMCPFWNSMYHLRKVEYRELLQIAFLLCFLREINHHRGWMSWLKGKGGWQVLAWCPLGCDRKGLDSHSRKNSAECGETSVV